MSSLAWPIVVVFVVIVFRGPIGEMIGRLEHVKTPWVELWTKAVGEARAVLAPSTVAVATTSLPDSLRQKFAHLAVDSPEGAVAMGWIEVDKRLRQKMAEAGIPAANSSVRQITDAALQGGVMSHDTATAIGKLATLRLLATQGHIGNLDSARALDFLGLADAAIFSIDHGKPERN